MKKSKAFELIEAELTNKYWRPNYIKRVCELYLNKNIHKAEVENLINYTCLFFDVSQSELLSKSRVRELVTARSFMMKRLRKENEFTYTFIGNIFKKNHATVIHSIDSLDDLMTFDKKLKKKYDQFIKGLGPKEESEENRVLIN